MGLCEPLTKGSVLCSRLQVNGVEKAQLGRGYYKHLGIRLAVASLSLMTRLGAFSHLQQPRFEQMCVGGSVAYVHSDLNCVCVFIPCLPLTSFTCILGFTVGSIAFS